MPLLPVIDREEAAEEDLLDALSKTRGAGPSENASPYEAGPSEGRGRPKPRAMKG